MKLVTFTLTPYTNVEAIVSIIKSQSAWPCVGNDTWLVGGDLTYIQLRDLLQPFHPDTLLVIPFNYSHWSGLDLSKDVQDFLNNYIEDD